MCIGISDKLTLYSFERSHLDSHTVSIKECFQTLLSSADIPFKKYSRQEIEWSVLLLLLSIESCLLKYIKMHFRLLVIHRDFYIISIS